MMLSTFIRGSSEHFTLRELGDSYGCALYFTPYPTRTRDYLNMTLANAAAHGVDQMNPWVALAGGWVVTDMEHYQYYWADNNDYDQQYSWRIGAGLNNANYTDPMWGTGGRDASVSLVLYPGMWDRCPNFLKHFVAYVCGANGIMHSPLGADFQN